MDQRSLGSYKIQNIVCCRIIASFRLFVKLPFGDMHACSKAQRQIVAGARSRRLGGVLRSWQRLSPRDGTPSAVVWSVKRLCNSLAVT
jgi:hypothetical protein